MDQTIKEEAQRDAEYDYRGLCEKFGTDPAEFETQTLSVVRSFLPKCALKVLDGATGTAKYWDWLSDQLEGAEQGVTLA
jgi:hypothetical protein